MLPSYSGYPAGAAGGSGVDFQRPLHCRVSGFVQSCAAPNCQSSASGPNDGPMMTRLEYACFQANPDCEMDVGMGPDGNGSDVSRPFGSPRPDRRVPASGLYLDHTRPIRFPSD